MIDIVTVYYDDQTEMDALELRDAVLKFDEISAFHAVSNKEINRGFAKACNIGAASGSSPIIGFLNPDTQIFGDFTAQVISQIMSGVTITGERFGKPERELRMWGCKDWVCGAAFFVERKWFESVGGFDERFVWSWEETALIRLAQEQGKKVKSIELPLQHESPSYNSPKVSEYKNRWFEHGQKIFYKEFPVRGRR